MVNSMHTGRQGGEANRQTSRLARIRADYAPTVGSRPCKESTRRSRLLPGLPHSPAIAFSQKNLFGLPKGDRWRVGLSGGRNFTTK
jgi:hypothetical protein